MKSFIANTIVKWFKSIPFAGRFRFWCLYWAYRITGWHIRSKEWDFVLEYLPPLMKGQKVAVLDVGCSRNLFCFEVVGRGYELNGMDLEIPDFKYPGDFFKHDVTNGSLNIGKIDFVTCISVLEHIEEGQDRAIRNMIRFLKIGGRLLLTIPTHEFAQGHPWHGFSWAEIFRIFDDSKNFGLKTVFINACERAGQLCMAIERVA